MQNNSNRGPLAIVWQAFPGVRISRRREGTTLDVYDDLTIVRGRHTFKMGIGVERHQLNNSSEAVYADGTLSYASPDDFINNVLDDYFYSGELTLGGHRRTYIMPYVQDTFKVRPNLTLNLGFRYEHYTVL